MKYKTEAEVEVDYPFYGFVELEMDSAEFNRMNRWSVVNGITMETFIEKLNSFDRSWADGL